MAQGENNISKSFKLGGQINYNMQKFHITSLLQKDWLLSVIEPNVKGTIICTQRGRD
jgi:hypothetical protein